MLYAALTTGWFDHLETWLRDFGNSPWLPLVIFAVALLDSIVPIVPGETMVIIGGVAAGTGDQNIGVVIAAGAIGAFTGDNLAYLLGRRASGFLRRTLFRGEKGGLRLAWAEEQLRMRGGLLLITARFIPGGRTVVTVSSGITHRPRRWFMTFDAIACVIWASYAALLGFFGGKAFEDDHTKAFLVAFAGAISVTVVIELLRWFRAKRRGELADE
jgi:membrane protein DedA with SNARE-associated domain